MTKPLSTLVEATYVDHAWLKREYGKIEGVLKAFAEHGGRLLRNLTLLDAINDIKPTELNPDLETFIDGLKESTAYKQQIKSRLRRIIRIFCAPAMPLQQSEMVPSVLDVPEFMKRVLPALPRRETNGDKDRSRVLPEDEEQRLQHALTETGSQLLLVLLLVVEEQHIEHLDSLFNNYRSHIYDAIRRILPPRRWQPIICALFCVRRRLGYFESSVQKEKLELEHWPAGLRRQFECVRELTPDGITRDVELTRLTAEHNVKVGTLEESTLRLYENSISLALPHILPHVPEDQIESLSIRDFLTLKPREDDGSREDETSSGHISPLVELYREHEKEKTTDSKGARYDSSQFRHFIHGIRAMAVYNGFVGLYKTFRDQYQMYLDFKRRKEKKELEKDTFDRAWVDCEIGRMLPIFRRIVKKESFKFDTRRKHYSYHDAQKDMRFCLFFVLLVVLRYMGHRQQQLRNCKLGENIFFPGDGSVRFNWKDDLIKNDVEIDQEVLAEHETHKILIEVLRKYHKHIYLPFVMKNGATSPDGKDLLGGQFFVGLNQLCKFVPFHPTSHKSFYDRFRRWSLEFMEFGDRANRLKRGLHPHFFRGLAVDWLVNDKKVPLQKTADYFGISVKTLLKHYLREASKKSSSAALEAANSEINARKSNDQLEKAKAELAHKDAELKQAKLQVVALQSKLIEAYEHGILAAAGSSAGSGLEAAT